jgi:hypothetical protein
MTSLKITGLRLVVLVALQALGASASQSQTPAAPAVPDEVSKQAAIYASRGEARPEGYVVDRSLLSYGFTLPAEFHRSLADLGPEHRWLDIGAGEGRAILDYCTSKYDVLQAQGRMQSQAPKRRGKKAKAIAMSIEDRRTPQWHQTAASLEDEKQIQYLFGKRLREYSLEELGGPFQVITDVMGGFSYAQDLTVFMEKTLGFLEPSGTFYTVLQDVRSEEGTNQPFYPGASFLTEIKKADGSDLKICSWLKSISCVEVTCELKADWQPPIEVYSIRKTCNDVAVPRLEPTRFEAGTPPERKFRLTDTPAQTTATR